jgi:hypothetical protein
MNDKIFVSYRRADTAAIAGRIYDRLNILFPDSVFLDAQDIEPGIDFIDKIERTIGSCGVFILLIGNNWFGNPDGSTKLGDKNDFITLEIKSAIKQKILIIPVLVDGAQVPKEETLPPSLQLLTHINALEIRHSDFDYGISKLAKPIYSRLNLKHPTSLERFMETSWVRFFNSGIRHDEKQRVYHAFLCFFMSAGLFISVLSFFQEISLGDIYKSMAITVPFAYTGLIGLNSHKYRKLAILGLILLGAYLLMCLIYLGYENINNGISLNPNLTPIRNLKGKWITAIKLHITILY